MFAWNGCLLVVSGGAQFEIVLAGEQTVGVPPRSVLPHNTLNENKCKLSKFIT